MANISLSILVLIGFLLQTTDASPLTEQQIAEAVKYGQSFKSRNDYLDRGLKNRKFQIASAWAKDGIGKYIVLFSDFDVTASAASKAKHAMRELTKQEVSSLPLTGLLYVNAQLHARGALPINRLHKNYTRDNVHLVLMIDNAVIQPVSKQLGSPQDASFVAPVALFTYWETNNVSLLTGGPLGFSGERLELEFAFKLTAEQMAKEAIVVLIDGNGKQHKTIVDLSKIGFHKAQ
jgi:hypothetical protein